MNKQAITFLTLFSLILVLSIYYILLPPESDGKNQVNINGTDDSQIVSLQQELDKKRETIISENNDIIASSKSDTESISKALETIAEAKEISAKEKEIVGIIKKLGYDSCFVEVEGKTVKVVVEKKDSTANDANSIIKGLMAHLGSSYQIEVKFIDN